MQASTSSAPQYDFPSVTTPNKAPTHPLPSTSFYSIEYPGYVRPESVPKAVQNLGGSSSLEAAFRRGASKAETLVELQLRPGNSFAHPVPGEVVATNSIVFKVTKRKRKNRTSDNAGNPIVGDYKAEAIGVLPKVVRFRSMVDYQYQPNPDDALTQLRSAMDTMNVSSISSYKIPPEKEDYTVTNEGDAFPSGSVHSQTNFEMNLDPQLLTGEDGISASIETPISQTAKVTRSNLRLFPPPLFSRQTIAQGYNFKANPASIISTVVDNETGEEKKRLINRMRWKGYGPATIAFADTAVPDKPPPNVEGVREQVDENIIKRLEELFEERPVWTRMSLFNQVSAAVAREIHNSKVILPLVCYNFQDGPWRDTLVRFGYDPRKDPEARFYQRLYFRNASHPMNRPSVITRRQERAAANTGHPLDVDQDERRTSHIFDGQTLTKETAAFQLCDIVDPMLKDMIENPSEIREVCHERDGWYSTHSLERIKIVLRHKFFSLLDGRIATDEECQAIIDENESYTPKTLTLPRSAKLRVGKHNMAKGAMRPEEAAAFRLRATLEREKKATMR
ncbi:tau 95 subunit of transcription factor TFIIIC [Stygiomarasmius scandens]|uniref:Tau 95 subunit of transcription factor TFIIIC n=1 Tax=Marasmiellus scandens TaxID=2682957 RepID=A0ABR1K6Y3_9AGAR